MGGSPPFLASVRGVQLPFQRRSRRCWTSAGSCGDLAHARLRREERLSSCCWTWTAYAGALPTIAPKRFNPDGKAWLPILHTSRGSWHFTALYSNTALAHELYKTHDWVVIYAYNDHHAEQQCTVVTETRRHLYGRRVVRGRESQCAAYYLSKTTDARGTPSRTNQTQLGSADR